MQVKLFIVLLFIEVTLARRCRPELVRPPFPDVVEFPNFLRAPLTQSVATPEIGRYKCAPICKPELILPPTRAELPMGLGYFPSVVPYVASCYNPAFEECDGLCDRVPVAHPRSFITIAAPLPPEWAPLVTPIIL